MCHASVHSRRAQYYMARQNTPNRTRRTSTTTRSTRPRTTRRKKPNRVVAYFASIPTRIKRLFIKIFLGVSVLSATFPAVTQSAVDWAGSKIDASQLQSLLAIPILGDILRHTELPSAVGTTKAPTVKNSAKQGSRQGSGSEKRETVKNPFV